MQKPVDAAVPMRGSAPFSDGVNPMPTLRFSVALCAAACVSACASGQRSIVETPMAPPLVSAPLNVNTQGAIYQAGTLMVLYETPRAQHIGDVLTIRLSESYSGNNSSTAAASRAS